MLKALGSMIISPEWGYDIGIYSNPIKPIADIVIEEYQYS